MGFACRRFLIDDDDAIGRLADATFERMLRDPADHRLPAFAGRRVRMAEVIVEGKGCQPVRVVRRTFALLAVDARGCIEAARFLGPQFARVEVVLAPVGAAAGEVNVVEATPRFAAQEGAWKPSPALELAIDDVSLGRRKCRRL